MSERLLQNKAKPIDAKQREVKSAVSKQAMKTT
jgi:hypothetical protein